MEKEKQKMNFNFPLSVEDGKRVRRAQVEFSESMGIKEFYSRALVAGAELLLSQRKSAPAVSEAAYMAETEAAKEKAKRERKAAAERERRRKKKEVKA